MNLYLHGLQKENYPEIFTIPVIDEIWLACLMRVSFTSTEAFQRQEILLEVEKNATC